MLKICTGIGDEDKNVFTVYHNISYIQAVLCPFFFYIQAVLGAFFHDIGHLVGEHRGLSSMVTDGVVLGVQDHDLIGEEYLQSLGVPSDVTKFVRGHVAAKRYLTYRFPEHYESKDALNLNIKSSEPVLHL